MLLIPKGKYSVGTKIFYGLRHTHSKNFSETLHIIYSNILGQTDMGDHISVQLLSADVTQM